MLSQLHAHTRLRVAAAGGSCLVMPKWQELLQLLQLLGTVKSVCYDLV
jgi:hypothetical protein